MAGLFSAKTPTVPFSNLTMRRNRDQDLHDRTITDRNIGNFAILAIFSTDLQSADSWFLGILSPAVKEFDVP
jgi:hypothetical protein